jgi:membrane-bound acyltransferase YfiQ involved in biofilm formation
MTQKIVPPGLLKPYLDFGYLGVAIFIMLSGYGLTSSFLRNQSLDNFFKKRMLKVYLPFVIISVSYSLIRLLNHEHDLDALFFNSTGVTLVDKSFWFVDFIIIAYGMFYVSILFFARNIFLAVCILTSLYWAICFYLDMGKWWYTTSFCFPFGIYLAANFNDCSDKLKSIKALIVCVSILAISTLIAAADSLMAPFAKTISATSFACLVFMLSQRISLQSRILSIVGIFSYEIYLCHILALYITPNMNDILSVIAFMGEVPLYVCILFFLTSKLNLSLFKSR